MGKAKIWLCPLIPSKWGPSDIYTPPTVPQSVDNDGIAILNCVVSPEGKATKYEEEQDLIAPLDGLVTPVRVDNVHDPGALLLLLAVLVCLVGRLALNEVVVQDNTIVKLMMN